MQTNGFERERGDDLGSLLSNLLPSILSESGNPYGLFPDTNFSVLKDNVLRCSIGYPQPLRPLRTLNMQFSLPVHHLHFGFNQPFACACSRGT